MIIFFCLVPTLLGFLLSIVVASSNYPNNVDELLEKDEFLNLIRLNKDSLGYKGYWFTNLVRIEKGLPEDYQITIKQLPEFAEKVESHTKKIETLQIKPLYKNIKALQIKALIKQHYETLHKDEKYHYQLLRALDKYISTETAAYMISTGWLKKKNTGSVKRAIQEVRFVCGASPVNGKTSISAKKKLENLSVHVENIHENVWFYITYMNIKKNSHYFKVERDIILLAPALSHRVSISEISKNIGCYSNELLLFQIKYRIFDFDNINELVKQDCNQKKLSREECIWTQTSLGILKEKSPKQLLYALLQKEGDFIIGTVPTFRLLKMKKAEEIVLSSPIETISHLYSVFVFGTNIGDCIPKSFTMKAAGYDREKLTELAGWIEALWGNTDIEIKEKSDRIRNQLMVPYLDLEKLFRKGQLDKKYAKEIANNDPIALQLINLIIDQPNELHTDQSLAYKDWQTCYGIRNTKEFCFGYYCDWNCAVTKHFRHLLSIFIVHLANASDKYKKLLESYLGYKYKREDDTRFLKFSIDLLKERYKLYEKAYEKVIQSVFDKLSTPAQEEGETETSINNYWLDLDTMDKESKSKLEYTLKRFDKVEICKDASLIDCPELTLDYCEKDLQHILAAKFDTDLVIKTGLSKSTRILWFDRSELTLDKDILHDTFPCVETKVAHNYVELMFQIKERPHSSSWIGLDIPNFYKLTNCKTDPLRGIITDYYLKLIARKEPLKISHVNFSMRKIRLQINRLVSEYYRLPRITLAIFNSLDLKRLKKEQLQDIMRDALLEDLSFPFAFLLHLLNAHFKMDIFQWDIFCLEMDFDEKPSFTDGIKALEKVKRISFERHNNYLKLLEKMRKVGLEMHTIYSTKFKQYNEEYKCNKKKKYGRSNLKAYDILDECKRLLYGFEQDLKDYNRYIEGLDYCPFETSKDFFNSFFQALKESFAPTQSTIESLTSKIDHLHIKEEPSDNHPKIPTNFFDKILKSAKQPSDSSCHTVESFSQSSFDLNIKESSNNHLSISNHHSDESSQTPYVSLQSTMKSFEEKFISSITKIRELSKKLN